MLKNVLKFLNKDSFILKKILLFVSFFVIAGFYGCDVCNTGDGVDKDANDIYFSALSMNSSVPGIYSVSSEGNRLREIIKDGILYSGPARDKNLIFLREKIGIDTLLFYMKINETVPHEIIIPGFPMISMPIISPDGKYFSLYVGNGQLIIFADKIFSPGSVFNFYIGTEPSFSPDGKYLAYYEKIGIFGPVNLKIINTDHPEEVIYTKEFQNLLNPMPGNATIDWSNDGRYIIYTSVDATLSTDIIHVDEVFGNTDYELKINGIGAYMPSLSPDKTEVVFAARDGNIWTRTIADERYTRMTEVDSTIEYNLYPQWTNDGKYIFYTKYYRDDTSKFGGTLEIVNLSTKKRLVLSNSILRGYKMRIKT